MAGTAAPLNPGYKEEEFRFYLDDTSARVLILPPEGADEARRAAGDCVPVLAAAMDATGTVRLSGVNGGRREAAPAVGDTALILHTSGSTGRPKRVPLHARQSVDFRQERRENLRSRPGGRVALRHAALPRARSRRLHAGDALDRWHARRTEQVQPTVLLARRARPRGHVVFGRADHPPAPAGPCRSRLGWRCGGPSACASSYCSAALPAQVMHDLEAAFGAPVLEAYGMTEAAHQMASNPLPPAARKAGSVGPGTRLNIVPSYFA